MKKVFLQLCTILVLVGLMVGMTITVSANSVVSGKWGDLSWELNRSAGHLTISGEGDMNDFDSSNDAWKAYKNQIVTLTIENGITSIGKYAFAEFTALKVANLPSTLKNIGTCAFVCCYDLSILEIPTSVEQIENGAFAACDNLIQEENGMSYVDNWLIECSSSVSTTDITWKPSTIGIANQAFVNCQTIWKLNLPSGLKYIGDYSLPHTLTSVTIPDSVTRIGNGVFSGCTELRTLKLPSSLTSLGDSAFFFCTALTSIEIPSGVTKIGDHTFLYCSSLTSVKIGDGVKSIGERAFDSCTALKSLTFGENSNLKIIKTGAFRICTSLTSIHFPSKLEKIGEGAFTDCINLKEIYLPTSLKKIMAVSFTRCDALETVYYAGCEEAWKAVEIHTSSNIKNDPEFGNEHLYGDWTEIDDSRHMRVCICNAEEYADHVFENVEESNDLQHKSTCVCGKIHYEDHSYETMAQYDENQHEYSCVCGKKKYEEHAFTDWERHNTKKHKHACACGEIQYASHYWDRNSSKDEWWKPIVCTGCGTTPIVRGCMSVTGGSALSIALLCLSAGLFTAKKKKHNVEN